MTGHAHLAGNDPRGKAIVTLPQHMDESNAGQIREKLLLVINRGATELIADLTQTDSCDHMGDRRHRIPGTSTLDLR